MYEMAFAETGLISNHRLVMNKQHLLTVILVFFATAKRWWQHQQTVCQLPSYTYNGGNPCLDLLYTMLEDIHAQSYGKTPRHLKISRTLSSASTYCLTFNPCLLALRARTNCSSTGLTTMPEPLLNSSGCLCCSWKNLLFNFILCHLLVLKHRGCLCFLNETHCPRWKGLHTNMLINLASICHDVCSRSALPLRN